MTLQIDGSLEETLLEYTQGLVITSARHMPLVSRYVSKEKLQVVYNADLTEAKILCQKIKDNGTDVVIAFGSGKVIDTTKHAATLAGKKFISIPSCLSTNCCFTDKSTLFENGLKHTLNSNLPYKVIFDWNLIQKNELMNTCGVVELLSSCTALTDWQIADINNKEPINLKIYKQAEQIALEAERLLFSKDLEDLKKQLKLLQASGNLAVEYGCGRPVSGSEHIMSAPIENHYRCPHGVALSISIPIMLSVQKNVGYLSNYENVMQKLSKNNPFKNYIKQLMDNDTVKLLLSKVIPRSDRYTAIDLINNQELLEIATPILDDIFS